MSEVFREVSFTYKGEDVTIVPSIALLRSLKAAGINNMALARDCVQGGADPLDLVTVHMAMMKKAGMAVTEDESYGWITGDNTVELLSFQTAYVQSVLPGIDLGKKPAAPSSKAKQKS